VNDPRPGDPLLKLLRGEAMRTLERDPQLLRLIRAGSGGRPVEDKWYEFVDEVSRRLTLHFGGAIFDHVVRGRVFDVFHSLGSAAALYFLLAPYFLAYAVHPGAPPEQGGEAHFLPGHSP
jgi:hypothetical protein